MQFLPLQSVPYSNVSCEGFSPARPQRRREHPRGWNARESQIGGMVSTPRLPANYMKALVGFKCSGRRNGDTMVFDFDS
jgi:hypothetical protein